ncbi:MAG: flippase-like domain-containing protein [Kosmotoga sp.]|nr:MAG: flippase-like domain-containing protein [Kosmotoga sp.]
MAGKENNNNEEKIHSNPLKTPKSEQKISYKNIFYAIFISVVVMLAIFAFLGKDLKLSYFLELSWYWIVGAIGLLVGAHTINAIRLVLLFRIFGIKFRFRDAFVNNFLMQYFNNITPLAVGGQPYQVYDLTARGINLTTAAAVIVSRYVTTNIAIIIIALIFLPQYWSAFLNIPGIGIFVFFGAFMSFAVLVLLATVSYSQKMLDILLKLLTKRKFMKKLLSKFLKCRPLDVREILREKFQEFHRYMLIVWRRGPQFMILDVFLAISFSFVFKFILYFVLLGITNSSGATLNASVIDIWGIQELLYLVAYYVPSPGASGAIEAGLFFMLGGSVSRSLLGVGIAVWRIITYHLFIVVGTIAFLGVKKLRNYNYEGTKEQDLHDGGPDN